MALTYVGGLTDQNTDGSALTVDISGISMQEDDIVVVYTGFAQVGDKNSGISSAGWTEEADIFANDSRDSQLSVNWKIMGSTPDTSFDCYGSGSTLYGTAAVVQVWRGVDTTTPMDVTRITRTATNSQRINPGSITPVTAGAIVIQGGHGACGSTPTGDPVPSTGDGYTHENVQADYVATARGTVIGMASIAWTSGAIDPQSWTAGGTDSTLSSMTAVCLALRPGAGGGGAAFTPTSVVY